MGLQERRVLQQIKEETERSEKELQSKVGINLSLTVDEASFPSDDIKVLNDFFIHKIYGLTSIIDAFGAICKDDIGKEAVADTIKHVQLINTAQRYEDLGTKKVEMEDGTLKIYVAFSGNTDSLYKPEPLAKEIESLL